MGAASTMCTSVWDLSSMAGPYLFGVTAHYLGYGPMFIMAGGLSLAGGVFFLTPGTPGRGGGAGGGCALLHRTGEIVPSAINPSLLENHTRRGAQPVTALG